MYLNLRFAIQGIFWFFFFKLKLKNKFFCKTIILKRKKNKHWKFIFLKNQVQKTWSLVKSNLIWKNINFFLRKKQSSFFLKSSLEKKLFIAKSSLHAYGLGIKINPAKSLISRNFTDWKNQKLTNLQNVTNFKYLYFNVKDTRLNFLKIFAKKQKTNKFINKQLKRLLASNQTDLILKQQSSILFILLKSRLVLSKNQLSELIDNKCVYYRNTIIQSPFYTISAHTPVQIIIFKAYFVYYIYSYNLLHKWVFKTGYCLWRFYRHKYNIYKQSPVKLPDWLVKLEFFKCEIPTYLEVDYTILTVVLISKVFGVDKQVKLKPTSNFNRLLTWKYVT